MSSCQYQGYEFGANYLDSVCLDGFLWDADSGYGTEDGWMYTHGGDIPCPLCNFKQASARLSERIRDISRDHGRGKNRKWFVNEGRRRLRRHLIREGFGGPR